MAGSLSDSMIWMNRMASALSSLRSGRSQPGNEDRPPGRTDATYGLKPAFEEWAVLLEIAHDAGVAAWSLG
ncbi:MAG: hypothetical protein Ct9H300mP12_07060 [Acidimicrobiales bacterium]|nr:MAG: hypothetical protein Ct9H300mP12_07060 [Acidimicrobiales bacterium]